MEDVKRKNVKLLRVIHMSDSFIFLWPVVILYYYHVTGNAVGAGIMLSARSITSTVAELPLGIFSDRFGRARTTQLASSMFLLSMLLTVAAWWLGFWALLMAVVIQGIGEAAESGNHDSLLFESSKDKKTYQKTSSWLGSFGYFAGATAAVIGGVLGNWSLLLVAAVSVAPRFVSLIASMSLIDVVSNEHDKETILASFKRLLRLLFRDTTLRYVVSGKVIAEGFGEVSWQYRALFVQTVWPIWAIGLSLPISLVMNAVGSALYARFQDKINRFRPVSVILMTTLLGRLMILVAFVIKSIASPVIIGLAGITGPTNRVTYTGLLHEKLDSSNRASGFSVVSLMSTLLFAIVSIGFGYLIDSIGVQKTLIVSSIGSLLSIPLYGIALARTKNSEKE